MSAEDGDAVSSSLARDSPPHLIAPAHPVPSKTSPTSEESTAALSIRLMSPSDTTPTMKLRKASAIPREPENPSLAGWNNHTANSVTFPILEYEKHNYQAWSFAFLNNVRGARLRAHLTDPGNCPTVEEVEADPLTGPMRETWLSNDDVVISRIMASVSRSEVPYIQHCKTAFEIWTTIEKRHKLSGPRQMADLFATAFSIRFTPAASTASTMSELRTVVRDIFHGGIPKEEDVLLVIVAIHALTDHFPDVRNRLLADMMKNTITPEDIERLLRDTVQQPSVTANIARQGGWRDRPRQGGGARGGYQATNETRRAPYCSACGDTCQYLGYEGHLPKRFSSSYDRNRQSSRGRGGGQYAPRGISRGQHANAAHSEEELSGSSSPSPSPYGGTVPLPPVSPQPAYTPSATANAAQHEPTAPSEQYAPYPSYYDVAPYSTWEDSPPDGRYGTDPYVHAGIAVAPTTSDTTASVDWALHVSDSPATKNTVVFIADSGASRHIVNDGTNMVNRRSANTTINGFNGSSVRAVAEGDLPIYVGGRRITLVGVLHVPQAALNLLSISQLATTNGLFTTFGDKACYLADRHNPKDVVFQGRRVATSLYVLEGVFGELNANAMFAARKQVDPTNLTGAVPIDVWHRRFGHVNHRSTADAARTGAVEGMPIDSLPLPANCDHCILGKQRRAPAPKVREGVRASKRLDVVHADLQGPFPVRGLGGVYYSLDLIDDFSSFCWSLLLAKKSDAIHALQLWEDRIARATDGERPRVYRTDNGAEFDNKFMRTHLEKWSGTQQFTAPYSSFQNGRNERLHLTIMNCVRTSLIAARLPDSLWPVCLQTAAYLATITPTSANGGRTPHELFWGRVPNVSHLREIGCRAFVLNETQSSKILARSRECILVGYAPDAKAYLCWDRERRTLVTSRNVEFIESHQERHIQYRDATTIPTTSKDPNSDTLQYYDEHPIRALFPPLPSLRHNPQLSTPAQTPAPTAPPQIQLIPISDEPRRSTRQRAAPGSGNARLREAVSASREAADRRREQRVAARANAATHIDEIQAYLADIDSRELTVSVEAVDDILATMADAGDKASINPARPADPRNVAEARASPDADRWMDACAEETRSLRAKGVYSLVHRSEIPVGVKVIGTRPVLTTKYDADGRPDRLKCRVVAQGYDAIQGIDYDASTSPTTRPESLRLILDLAARKGWKTCQIDVKTAYLNAPLDTPVYCRQPRGLEEEGKEEYVWKVTKALYGLPQSGRCWNQEMNDKLIAMGFKRLANEHCIYIRSRSSGTIVTGIHVDDFLGTASSDNEMLAFKADLAKHWTITDGGEAKFIVGIRVDRDVQSRTISLWQPALIDKIIATHGMTNAHVVATPLSPGAKHSRKECPSEENRLDSTKYPYRQLVGSLMYLAVGTRPDITHAVQHLSQFLANPGLPMWNSALHVVRYLKGTRELRLVLGGMTLPRLTGLVDSDFANCPDTRRSVSGFCFSMGSGAISWSSRKQPTVSGSSCEAEYVAAYAATREALWLRNVLDLIEHRQDGPTIINCDNQGAIVLTNDQSQHNKIKHIDVKYHLTRERVNMGQLKFTYIRTTDNTADIFTKALPSPTFNRLRHQLGLRFPNPHPPRST
jgi:hypothetical protein